VLYNLFTNSYNQFVVSTLVLFLLLVLPSSPVARADDYILVHTEGSKAKEVRLGYFRGNIPARDFYNYYETAPNTGLESPKSCLVIPYMAPSGRTSLIIIMGDPGSYYGGSGRLRISGLSREARLTLQDDPTNFDSNDLYSLNPPEATFEWSWDPGFADGVIVANIQDKPDLTLNFESLENVEEVRIVTGDAEDNKVTTIDPGSRVSLRGRRVDLSPVPKISAPETAKIGDEVTFSAGDSQVPEGRVVQYSWDFDGDGNFSYTSQKPTSSHSFFAPGRHEVALSILDNRGNRAKTRKLVRVVENPLRARRHLSARRVTPGGVVNCKILITAEAPVSGLGITESIPDNWKVMPKNRDDVVFKPSTNRWLVTSGLDSREKFTVKFNIQVPHQSQIEAGATHGRLKLSGEVGSANPDFETKISGAGLTWVTSSPPRRASNKSVQPSALTIPSICERRLVEAIAIRRLD